MRVPALFLCVAAALSTNTLAAEIGGPLKSPMIRAGENIAVNTCVACHVVAPEQDLAPVTGGPAPSFKAIANRPGMTNGALIAFMDSCARVESFAERCATASSLSEAERAQVAAYIMTLRAQH